MNAQTKKTLVLLIPLALFLVLGGFLFAGLSLKPREIPSPLIDKSIPAFDLPQLQDPAKRLASNDLLGQVTLVNAWASWCVSCRSEHELLMELAKQHNVRIYGINYKDRRDDALRYLQRLGNPYVTNGHDLNGRVGIDWGIIATPESFIVDKKGTIRYKQIGPLNAQVWNDTVAPLIKQLEQEQG